jgi:hypothetical protein
MTMNDVRSVMEHDAEQKTIDSSSESWGYLTDYEAEKMTWIIFTDGKVTGMKQSP